MRYELFHDFPKEDKGLVMFPVGMYYNRDIQGCAPGDTIIFLGGEEREVVSTSYFDLRRSSTDFLCRYIYGAELKKVFNKWVYNAILRGNGRRVLSEKKCLVIWYK